MIWKWIRGDPGVVPGGSKDQFFVKNPGSKFGSYKKECQFHVYFGPLVHHSYSRKFLTKAEIVDNNMEELLDNIASDNHVITK